MALEEDLHWRRNFIVLDFLYTVGSQSCGKQRCWQTCWSVIKGIFARAKSLAPVLGLAEWSCLPFWGLKKSQPRPSEGILNTGSDFSNQIPDQLWHSTSFFIHVVCSNKNNIWVLWQQRISSTDMFLRSCLPHSCLGGLWGGTGTLCSRSFLRRPSK